MNGKSLEFVRDRIKSGMCNGMENNKYERFFECQDSFPECFNNILSYPYMQENKLRFKLNASVGGTQKQGELGISVEYNPDAQFEYFTMERRQCDGTLIFYKELMGRAVEKILGLQTINVNNKPLDFDINPFIYNVEYTVGNFVIGMEYGDEFSTEEKSWMKSRFSIMLPIKCEFVRKNSD